MSTEKWATSKSTQLLGQTAPSAWKCPKTQFWGPLTNWKFEPFPRAHTHSDPIINEHTEQVKNYVWIYHGMYWTLCYMSKLSTTWKARIWLLMAFKTIPVTSTKTQPSFRKVSLPLAKVRMLFPAHLWFREFGHKSTPSDRPWIEAYCPKF